MKSYHIHLLLCGEQTRCGLVPKLVPSFKYEVQPARQNKFSQHLERSFTGALTFLLHSPNPRNRQPPSSCCSRLQLRKDLSWFIHACSFGSSKLRKDSSAEVFCNCLAPLKVSLAVDYVLDGAVSSAQLSLIYGLNPTEIRGHLGAFRF